MLIAIQELSTHWTKAARGAPLATLRNASPRTLRLPDVPKRSGVSDILHRVRFDERVDFEPRQLDEAVLGRRYSEIHGLTVVHDVHRARVTYSWTMACGAPERPASTPIWLAPGEWCQVLHNGRFALDSAPWTYQSTVINVALLAEFEADVFLKGSSTRVVDCLADLW